MKPVFFGLILVLTLSCKQQSKTQMTAQEIVDKSIEVSGGLLYKTHGSSFKFRGRKYSSRMENGKKVLERITYLDSVIVKDVKTNSNLKRYFNDSLVSLPDTLAFKYANSVNSVHYFSRLPYGIERQGGKQRAFGNRSHQRSALFQAKGYL